MESTATVSVWSDETSGATTTSTGRCTATLRSDALRRNERAIGIASGSTRLLPTSSPLALRKVFAIAPPMRITFTRSSSASSTLILSETFAPPSTAR